MCSVRFRLTLLKTITPERIEEMRQAIRKYGSGNCWTGTTGTLAVMILELLKERNERIQDANSTRPK